VRPVGMLPVTARALLSGGDLTRGAALARLRPGATFTWTCPDDGSVPQLRHKVDRSLPSEASDVATRRAPHRMDEHRRPHGRGHAAEQWIDLVVAACSCSASSDSFALPRDRLYCKKQ
jgi:hypothetical protein